MTCFPMIDEEIRARRAQQDYFVGMNTLCSAKEYLDKRNRLDFLAWEILDQGLQDCMDARDGQLKED